MKSMTGFGHSNYAGDQFELDVQIKSVNGRFLELRLHLPREYHAYETEIKKQLGYHFVRGTVDLYCNRKRLRANEGVSVHINEDAIRNYVKAFDKVGKKLGLKDSLSLDVIARLPEVTHLVVRDEVSKTEEGILFRLVGQAAKACEKERTREAIALKKDIQKNLQWLKKFFSEAQKLREQVNDELGKRFTDRLKNLGLTLSLDPARVSQEILIQIDRADINEELSRLDEHLAAYQKMLVGAESSGKKMDFYAQEILREVNTMGSKSQVAKLTALVVDAKAVVERIREQVQNIE